MSWISDFGRRFIAGGPAGRRPSDEAAHMRLSGGQRDAGQRPKNSRPPGGQGPRKGQPPK